MQCKLVVCSGAADGVMPRGQFPVTEALEEKRGVLVAAVVKDTGNYGRATTRVVTFYGGGQDWDRFAWDRHADATSRRSSCKCCNDLGG